jgi:hypothetical protein
MSWHDYLAKECRRTAFRVSAGAPSRNTCYLGSCHEIAETTPNCQPTRYLASAGSLLCGRPRKTLTWQYVAWSSAQVRGGRPRRPVIAGRCAMRPRHMPGSRNSSPSRARKSHSYRATTRSSHTRVSGRPIEAGAQLLWLAVMLNSTGPTYGVSRRLLAGRRGVVRLGAPSWCWVWCFTWAPGPPGATAAWPSTSCDHRSPACRLPAAVGAADLSFMGSSASTPAKSVKSLLGWKWTCSLPRESFYSGGKSVRFVTLKLR